ncbi:MAG: septum formation initiator family protein [Syntrophales bacterium]|jgi:cell division protein FtsB
MGVVRYVVVFVIFMAAMITFGDRGLVDNYVMHKKLEALQKVNQDISRENQQLKDIILLLRDNLSYIEMIARNDLGMVKKGDVVYRFAK